jgi:glycosyltransferase involved in cell wall biosynthesis
MSETDLRWSVMIPTFNCGEFLRQTLISVLVQDPGPKLMQIEVVDDASTQDDPADIVAELGRGRVQIFRQPHNLGHVGNFATCVARARGNIIHLLHGDDFVEPGFYAALERGFAADPECGAAFSASNYVNESGVLLGTTAPVSTHAGRLDDGLGVIASEQRIMTPSIVVRRDVYAALGTFDPRLKCAEDWEMWVRIAAHYPIWHDPAVLANYRMHENSNTGRNIRSARDMAAELAGSGDRRAALAQLWQAFRLYPRPGDAYRALRVLSGSSTFGTQHDAR